MNLDMRDANFQDSMDFLEWRNQDLVRKFSHNDTLITEQEHLSWFSKRLKLLPNEPFWVFENEEGKLGLIRFDLNAPHNYFETSILVNPSLRGHGYGRIILNQGLWHCLETNPTVNFYAEVHQDNMISQKLFLNSGFKESRKKNKFLVFERAANS